ncbi:MAG: redoxin domain-containing protein [Bacteroidota bacterium]
MKTKSLILLFILTQQLFSQNPAKPKATVYVFLSEVCPICQSYTLPLKKLYESYKDKGIRFVGLFPNEGVSKKDVNSFRKTYDIPFDMELDEGGVLAKKFRATLTPEVFVEGKPGVILYTGRIDDSFYAVGKRRNSVSTHELEDALAEITSKQKIKQPRTQAVGCIISSSK